MHFMLQKEVVNRLVAGPGSKAYGRLSVMAQYYCQVIPVLEVPPQSFTPPEELIIDTAQRAENVSVAQYCQLANWLGNHQAKTAEN